MKTTLLFLLFSLLTATLSAQQPAKQVIYTDKAPKPIGPYSQAILSGNTLYAAGQIALDPETGKMDTLSIESEIQRVLKNLGAVLDAAGMTYGNIVKTTIYTTDLKYFKIINSIYGQYFKENPPARETVQVVALPAKAHVEISAIATK
ncbi:MAG: Rid family detoxifying hydrolase [Bacteroidetes bacterium]|nr:Rid family detoxifying hydrolase [Bacteroidota bacterium]